MTTPEFEDDPQPLEGRLFIGELLIREFDHEVDRAIRCVFTRAMASSPTADGLLVFEAPAYAIGDRLDALGADANRAIAHLDASLELARSAYAGMQSDDDPASLVSDQWRRLLSLDWVAWVRLLGADSDSPNGVYAQWLLGMANDLEAATVLRLCALARPDDLVRLELPPDESLVSDGVRRRLVVTQTADDAEALRFAIQGRRPHLSDLVVVSHLGGDGTPEALSAQIRGLLQLRLLQQLTAVFLPGSDDVAADLLAVANDPQRLQALVAPTVPAYDPPAVLAALFGAIGIGTKLADLADLAD